MNEFDRMSLKSEATTSLVQALSGHTSDVTSCDFAPNFTLITGSSDKTVRLWDWRPGTGYVAKSFSPLRGHKYGVTCVKVSPQGSMLATTSIDGTAVLWNLHSGNKIHTMVQVNGDAIRVCRFAPDSSVLVTAGDNGAICVWNLIHRSLIRTIFQHEGTTQGLTFTPDSQYLISACSSEYIHVWHLQKLVDTTDEGACSPVFSLDNAHDLGILSLDVSNNILMDDDDPFTKYYTLASSGNSDEIKIWKINSVMVPKHKVSSDHVSLEQEGSLIGHSSAVTCVKYTSSGLNLVSSSLDKLVKIWDNNGACLHTLQGHTRYVNCVAFSRDFSLVASGSTGSNDKSVIIWDVTGDLNIESELNKSHAYLGSFYLPDGIQEDNVVLHAENEQNSVDLIEKIEDIFEGAINSCSFCDNDLVAIGSSDKLVRLFYVTEEGTLEETNCSPIDGHQYIVNHVEFSKDGNLLVSCSLDGWVYIWDPKTGEKVHSIPENKLSIRVSRFSPDVSLLVTAGDDQIATIWDVATMEAITSLEGHSDTISCAAFSPDGKIVVTTCHNADFRLWTLPDGCNIHVQDDSHDLGVQSCDFSDNLEPIPNINLNECQTYLLATSGNDAKVKIWSITIPKIKNEDEEEGFDIGGMKVKIWRTLEGHGGTVFCVRFSPQAGELVCSTATDHQARIWSVYSANCLHVLDHDSIVTSCAFSQNSSLLLTGCFDKTLWIWKLPQQLIFQTAVATKLKSKLKTLVDWNTTDVVKWLQEVGLDDLKDLVSEIELDGEKIITNTDEDICCNLGLDDEQGGRLMKELRWLKEDEHRFTINYWNKVEEIPDEYICPITQEVMREPVKIEDGFTYEKRAISEWFMSGKFTSPMTNATLETTDYTPNLELRDAIHTFIYE